MAVERIARRQVEQDDVRARESQIDGDQPAEREQQQTGEKKDSHAETDLRGQSPAQAFRFAQSGASRRLSTRLQATGRRSSKRRNQAEQDGRCDQAERRGESERARIRGRCPGTRGISDGPRRSPGAGAATTPAKTSARMVATMASWTLSTSIC